MISDEDSNSQDSNNNKISNDEDWDLTGNSLRATEGVNRLVKGNKAFHSTTGHNYTMQFNTSKTSTVNVIDKTAASAKVLKKGGAPKGDWVFRLDKPHKGAQFDHININPNISGVPDPHLRLPEGGLTAGTRAAKYAKVINKVNKVAVPVALALDAVETGAAAYTDYQHGTTRNTVETVAGVAGGWGGAYGGATAGAAIGTAILPGVGTIAGSIFGGIGGSIGGACAAGAVTNLIGDASGYDIITKKCKKCQREFSVRLYRGEDSTICPSCAA